MSNNKKVKNISGKTQEVVNIGIVEPDGVIEVSPDFHNANFVEAKQSREKKVSETESETDSEEVISKNNNE